MPNSLELLIRSGNPLISIETLDEQRALKVIRDIALKLKKPWQPEIAHSARRQTGTVLDLHPSKYR